MDERKMVRDGVLAHVDPGKGEPAFGVLCAFLRTPEALRRFGYRSRRPAGAARHG